MLLQTAMEFDSINRFHPYWVNAVRGLQLHNSESERSEKIKNENGKGETPTLIV